MSGLRLLVVGGGGREHALVWALRRSARAGEIYAAPGNAGIAGAAACVPFEADDVHGLLAFARAKSIELTVVGPEAPLALGIVDAFQAAGLRVFGPTQAAARLEASKAFAKAFMLRHHIPTARYAAFDSYDQAAAYVQQLGAPLVVKADGLAAGKGVVVCDTTEQALDALRLMLVDGAFGAAGQTALVEERLSGPEVSVLAFCDGHNVTPMPPARDHKRIYDGDAGPNTGGMGAYAPVPDVAPALLDEIARTVLQPTVASMAAEGAPYSGVLYAGLMLTPDGPRVLEFNCRFGDPETQAILPLLETDLLDVLLACTEGRLGQLAVRWQARACAAVVASSPGYPGSYPQGLPISGAEGADRSDVFVFHAGTGREAGQLVTAGGRVLAVSALGADLDTALRRAYQALDGIHFDGMHYRRDIGHARAH